MARIAGHYVPASGMLLFAAEAAVVAGAARAGWAVGAAPHGKVFWVGVSCAVALQIAFYWADLYDVRVAADALFRARGLALDELASRPHAAARAVKHATSSIPIEWARKLCSK